VVNRLLAAGLLALFVAFAALPAQAAAPAKVTGLTATAGDKQVTFSWDNPNDSSITGYEFNLWVLAGDDNYPPVNTDWHAIPGSDANTTEYTLTGLKNLRDPYVLNVRAVNGQALDPAERVTFVPNLPPRVRGGGLPHVTVQPVGRRARIDGVWYDYDVNLILWEYFHDPDRPGLEHRMFYHAVSSDPSIVGVELVPTADVEDGWGPHNILSIYRPRYLEVWGKEGASGTATVRHRHGDRLRLPWLQCRTDQECLCRGRRGLRRRPGRYRRVGGRALHRQGFLSGHRVRRP
jgi:hypothetical protein